MKRSLLGLLVCLGLAGSDLAVAQVDDDAPGVEGEVAEPGAQDPPAGTDAAAAAEPPPAEADAAQPPPPEPPPAAAPPVEQPPPPPPEADTGAPAEDPYAASSFDTAPPPDESGEYDADAGLEPEGEYTGPFSQGSLGIGIVLGSATYGESDYVILGAGFSYFIFDGLSLGLDGDIWLGDDPSVYTLTPQARYVLYFVPVLKPYVGAFYRRYFIEKPFDDLNSVGGRAGAYLVTGGGGYLGLGAIYERFLSCDDTLWECDGWYPEISVGFSL
jgi:hypothetical protein